MDGVPTVRAFNRTVTERIGALADGYLGRDRPLGASRVLWETGPAGADVRDLRVRLGLDSGYLSRLLRRLESDGLVAVEADPDDRRVRRVRLTPAGRDERAHFDARSDALAATLLEPLSESQRARLVEAMEVVERLLTAGLVSISVEDPRSDAAMFCLRAYFAELDVRFDAGFDPSASRPDAGSTLLLARLRGEPIGCGALNLLGDGVAELKRMWVAESARGLGVGRRILSELESLARDRDVAVLRLETNRSLVEAQGLYRAAGYVEVPAFNSEPYAHHWFEKTLNG
jgi:DNA-binding MarR family transcriptional regulator/GNAT superfamily N-acetyltransferase